MTETLDRESLAVALQRRGEAANRPVDVLAQVNLSRETQKAGIGEDRPFPS